jgi:hypothetical protein
MSLRGQDIVVGCKLSLTQIQWTENSLSIDLSLPKSEIHYSLMRLSRAKLYDEKRRKILQRSLFEFLSHGVKYFFALQPGGPALGMPTEFSCPTLKSYLSESTFGVPVWPDPHGSVYGYTVLPLHKCVPKACSLDGELYELLSLVDAIREGGARSISVAIDLIDQRLNNTQS